MPENNSSLSSHYAPVVWESADDDTIPDFSVNSSVQGKYKSTVSNILSKHCSEVKNASDEIVQPIISMSKKKLKELIIKHNNELFSFLSQPDKTPQMIGLAETIFRRYGHEVPTIRGNNVSTILKDLNLDVSMCKVTEEFNEG